MSQVRNWLQTLWPASYKSAPFYFAKDEEDGGRGIVVHVFPNRDDPFNEDLGQNPRHYGGHAYVHGDDADAKAAALIAACTSPGPGPLVVPLFGPVPVRCLTFRRRQDKDKLGFVAFEVRFVREGASTALVSIGSLANAAYGAADALSQAAGANFASSIIVNNQPDFVVAAAADGVATAAAVLDTARTDNAVDPAASSTLRDQLSDLVTSASTVISNDGTDPAAVAAIGSSVVQAARDLGDAMAPTTAAAVMASITDAFPPPGTIIYLSPSQAMEAANAAAAARLARLAALTAFADALIARSYPDRPSGITARAQASARFQSELEQCAGAADADLYIAIQNLRNAVIDYLTTLINDLKPVVTAILADTLPSLVLAWRLYADPTRGDELVARNQVRHPSFMPLEFQALAA